MSQIAFVSGKYLPHHLASTHIEDRGYQFADGIYEVVAVYGGQNLDEEGHLARLFKSLNEIHLSTPYSKEHIQHIMAEIKKRNHLQNGLIYLQITRGVARREHPFPARPSPELVITAKHMAFPQENAIKGLKVMTTPDNRWGRCDIKSVGLLPNVLAIQKAKESGFDDAWLINQKGIITEGTASNAWIVDEEGVLRTHPITPAILKGITRTTLLHLAQKNNIAFNEKAFTLEDIAKAREAFVTSATKFVYPVIQIDDKKIGPGKPGPLTLKLRNLYLKHFGY